MTATTLQTQKRPAARTIGLWLATPMAALQALNAVRALADPVGFATYFGAPIGGADMLAWVQVYGLRTAFIAAVVTVLLLRRDLQALMWTAIVALVLPLGDAWLTHQSGADPSIVARHLAIAAYLAVTSGALFIANRSAGRAS
jgi:hypothetical protein